MGAHGRRLLVCLGGGLLLAGCTSQDVINVAVSRDPSKALASLARQRVTAYERDPARLVADLKAAQRQYQQWVSFLRGEVGKSWGQEEVLTPSKKTYVKYTQSYQSRAVVEFDTGRITVETLDQQHGQASLRAAIVTTLLTPDDPRSVDLYSDQTVALSGTPYLYGLVVDHRGQPIDSPQGAEAFADYLLANRAESRTVTTPEGEKGVRLVHLTMVSDFANRQAQRFQGDVDQYSAHFAVSKSLVYAVIKTESAFNPFAVSPVPAYGLMQLVPVSGGRDAYAAVKGRDEAPTKEYLFDARNNIELGTAYLNLLDQRYLAGISDPLSREYCTIASYNGGAGNVFKVFSANRSQAVGAINGLAPAEVYRKLRDEHPSGETRQYLQKVLAARREFVNL